MARITKRSVEATRLHLDELKVESGSSIVGKPLEEVEIRSRHGFLTVALKRADGEIVMHPPPDTKLQAGDTIVAVGHQDDIPSLNAKHLVKQALTYRGVKVGS